MVSVNLAGTASAQQALTESEQCLAADDLIGAEEHCRVALKLRPRLPDGLNLLGRIVYRQGRRDIGIALLKQAVTSNRHSATFQRQLGTVLLESGSVDEAISHLLTARSLNPKSSQTLHSLGQAFVARSQLANAEACYRDAVSIEPRDARACFELINVLQSQGQQQQAQDVFEDAVALMPGFRRTHLLAAHQLQHTGKPDAARRTLEHGLSLQPHDEELTFSLEALNGGTTFQRAPDRFVAAYFDRYAPTFDEHLLDQLDYHAPQLVAQSIRDICGSPDGTLAILDMGCGTGLCGPLLKPLARRMVGVDLSSGMLDQARKRDIYDELVVDELTAYLSSATEQFDLIIAADVLVYFGDLGPVFAGVSRILQQTGRCIASFERSDTPGYRLHSGGRYAHSDEYLRDVAATHRLDPIRLDACLLRTEFGQPVQGYLGVFRLL